MSSTKYLIKKLKSLGDEQYFDTYEEASTFYASLRTFIGGDLARKSIMIKPIIYEKEENVWIVSIKLTKIKRL